MTDQTREEVKTAMDDAPKARWTEVLDHLGIASSTWYRIRPEGYLPRKRGRKPRPLDPRVEQWVVNMARENPWYGYKRIAVMCRREDQPVKNRQAYVVMKAHDLLQKRRPRKAELYQAAKLFELLPNGPNDLWQMDVTYIHIPGFGWWYAISVIDYYSRYCLALHLTSSYSAAEAVYALTLAREEAERVGGPLTQRPFLVTDNGSSFIARRFQSFVNADYAHVRIRYRTPTQLGLLERFHRTLKDEEVYWRMYTRPTEARGCLEEFRTRYNTRRPHWALIPPDGGDPLTPEDVYVQGLAVGIPKWQSWAVAARAKLDQMMAEDAA
ncbi:MAG: DDE-type integrase/transposase/recombinase [Chitinivibrionales bacterium]|nr:DDE-type integrase/transposase/recombinase [Chitinivibrionales bacterium]